MQPNLNSRPNYIPRLNVNGPGRRLSSAQLYLLEMYNLQYNELMQQINTRYIDATNIRHNMNAIIATTFPGVSTSPINANATTNANANANTSSNPFNYINSYNRNQYSPIRPTNLNDLRNPRGYNLFNSFFDNVAVSPSTEQIDVSTRTLPFRDIVEPINDRCPISFETFRPDDNVLQIIHCGHIFNPCEIAVWFRSNVGCPVCRYDIRNHRNNNDPSPLTTTLEETKEENGNQEHKEDESATASATTSALDNTDANTEALIEALLHVLFPGTTTTGNPRPATNSSSISYDPSNNMYFVDYYLGGRT
jgi:hypothetical protein